MLVVQIDQGLWWDQEGNHSVPYLWGNKQNKLGLSHKKCNVILQVLDGGNEKTKYDIHNMSELHITIKQLKTVDHFLKSNLTSYLRSNNMHDILNGQCIDTTTNQP